MRAWRRQRRRPTDSVRRPLFLPFCQPNRGDGRRGILASPAAVVMAKLGYNNIITRFPGRATTEINSACQIVELISFLLCPSIAAVHAVSRNGFANTSLSPPLPSASIERVLPTPAKMSMLHGRPSRSWLEAREVILAISRAASRSPSLARSSLLGRPTAANERRLFSLC